MTTAITRQQFLQALREHPDWREEVRLQILGEELMRLPVAFQAFVVRQEKFNDEMREFHTDQLQFNDEMREFHTDQLQFNDEMREFRTDQLQFNDEMREFRREALQRFENLDRRLDRMEHDSSWLKGFSLEHRSRNYAFGICLTAGCQLERVLERAEIEALARSIASSAIPPGDLASFANADMVIEARRSGETVYLPVEISFTAAPRDQQRAVRNAGYLADNTGHVAIPVVAGVRYDNELQADIDQGNIIWFPIEEPG